jgi:hypothetical protein
MERVEAKRPDLRREVEVWAAEHPDGTLAAAVDDLEILKPGQRQDPDARYLVWQYLPRDHPAKLVLPGES